MTELVPIWLFSIFGSTILSLFSNLFDSKRVRRFLPATMTIFYFSNIVGLIGLITFYDNLMPVEFELFSESIDSPFNVSFSISRLNSIWMISLSVLFFLQHLYFELLRVKDINLSASKFLSPIYAVTGLFVFSLSEFNMIFFFEAMLLFVLLFSQVSSSKIDKVSELVFFFRYRVFSFIYVLLFVGFLGRDNLTFPLEASLVFLLYFFLILLSRPISSIWSKSFLTILFGFCGLCFVSKNRYLLQDLNQNLYLNLLLVLMAAVFSIKAFATNIKLKSFFFLVCSTGLLFILASSFQAKDSLLEFFMISPIIYFVLIAGYLSEIAILRWALFKFVFLVLVALKGLPLFFLFREYLATNPLISYVIGFNSIMYSLTLGKWWRVDSNMKSSVGDLYLKNISYLAMLLLILVIMPVFIIAGNIGSVFDLVTYQSIGQIFNFDLIRKDTIFLAYFLISLIVFYVSYGFQSVSLVNAIFENFENIVSLRNKTIKNIKNSFLKIIVLCFINIFVRIRTYCKFFAYCFSTVGDAINFYFLRRKLFSEYVGLERSMSYFTKLIIGRSLESNLFVFMLVFLIGFLMFLKTNFR